MAAHRDGVPWNKAPLPPEVHVCRSQSKGMQALGLVDRCACGAMRIPGISGWDHKNWRRDHPAA